MISDTNNLISIHYAVLNAQSIKSTLAHKSNTQTLSMLLQKKQKT